MKKHPILYISLSILICYLTACSTPIQTKLQVIQDDARSEFMGKENVCQPFSDKVAAELDEQNIPYRRVYATINGRLHTAIQVENNHILDSNNMWVVPVEFLNEYDTGIHPTADAALVSYTKVYGDSGRMRWFDL